MNENEELSVFEQGSDHYKQGNIQPIEYIFANNIGFAEGNVIKYITRYPYSDEPLEDLKKAKHYLEMLIEHLEND